MNIVLLIKTTAKSVIEKKNIISNYNYLLMWSKNLVYHYDISSLDISDGCFACVDQT